MLWIWRRGLRRRRSVENFTAALEWPDLIVTSISSGNRFNARGNRARHGSPRQSRVIDESTSGAAHIAPAWPSSITTYLYNVDDLTEIVEQNKKARGGNSSSRSHSSTNKSRNSCTGRPELRGCGAGDLRTKLAAEREAFSARAPASISNFSERDRAQSPLYLKSLSTTLVLNPAERLRGIPDLRRKLQNLEALRIFFTLIGRSLEAAADWDPRERLALWQARSISEALRSVAGIESELVIVKTSGDKFQQKNFGEIGTKGVFIKELEDALLEHRVDLAVHSMKTSPRKFPRLRTQYARSSAIDARSAISSTLISNL